MVDPPPEMPKPSDATLQNVKELAVHHASSVGASAQNLLDRGNLTKRSDDMDATIQVHTGPVASRLFSAPSQRAHTCSTSASAAHGTPCDSLRVVSL